MKLLIPVIGLLLICGCNHGKPKQQLPQFFFAQYDPIVDRLILDETIRKECANRQAAWYHALKEPGIDTVSREVYRFEYIMAFGPALLFRAEQLPDSGHLLTSKFIMHGGISNFVKRPPLPYTTFTLAGEGDYVLITTSQKMNTRQWNRFLSILNGSYYWAIKQPNVSDGIMDGNHLHVKFKSIWPHGASRYELALFEENFHAPVTGSLTDACDYLGKQSVLFKRLGFPAPLIRKYN